MKSQLPLNKKVVDPILEENIDDEEMLLLGDVDYNLSQEELFNPLQDPVDYENDEEDIDDEEQLLRGLIPAEKAENFKILDPVIEEEKDLVLTRLIEIIQRRAGTVFNLNEWAEKAFLIDYKASSQDEKDEYNGR